MSFVSFVSCPLFGRESSRPQTAHHPQHGPTAQSVNIRWHIASALLAPARPPRRRLSCCAEHPDLAGRMATISWPAYFRIRRAARLRRNVLALTAAPVAFVAGTAGAANSLVVDTSSLMMAGAPASAESSAQSTILGVDPPLFYSLVALGAGATCAVVAPVLCDSLLRRMVVLRSAALRVNVENMDADLRRRVLRNRCAPTDILAAAAAAGMGGGGGGSVSGSGGRAVGTRFGLGASPSAARAKPSAAIAAPAPDFYGEKIESVAGYRAWLRAHRQALASGSAATASSMESGSPS